MSNGSADLIEVFSSIQGEGLLVGARQVFIRFHGCNLTCTYCDTESDHPPVSASLEQTPGRRDFQLEKNPVALRRVLDLLRLWVTGWPGVHHSISITGGEPLMNHQLLLEWLPELRRLLPVCLETNGVLHHALEELIAHLDYVSMDIKLPSTSGCPEMWQNHRNFLEVARQKKVSVKIVIGEETEEWEISKASQLIAEIDVSIPCILQPVTLRDGSIGIVPLKMLEFQEIAAGCLTDVRIIPQTHKFMSHL